MLLKNKQEISSVETLLSIFKNFEALDFPLFVSFFLWTICSFVLLFIVLGILMGVLIEQLI